MALPTRLCFFLPDNPDESILSTEGLERMAIYALDVCAMSKKAEDTACLQRIENQI